MDESIGFLMRDTSRLLVEALHARIRQHGVRIAHWQFLRVLWERDGISQRELGEGAKRMGATTVSAIDSMERSGLVRRVRSTRDRRLVHVYLTPKARKLEGELAGCVDEVLRISTRGMGAHERQAIRTLLLRMRANLERAPARKSTI